MGRKPQIGRLVSRWLDAERSGRLEQAETALSGLFGRLGRPAPAPGFAGRVLARCGMVPLPAPSHDLAGFRARAAVVLTCLATAVAVIYLPSLVEALWVGIRAGRPLELTAALLLGLTQRLADGVAIWRVLTDVVGLVAAALSSPQMLAVLAGACLLSAGAFRLLQGLLVSERSAGYVDLG